METEMPYTDTIYAGTFHPQPHGGVMRLKRIPVDKEGIHVARSRAILRLNTDEFTVESLREALSGVGFTLVDSSVKGIGYGPGFFFDFKADPSTSRNPHTEGESDE